MKYLIYLIAAVILVGGVFFLSNKNKVSLTDTSSNPGTTQQTSSNTSSSNKLDLSYQNLTKVSQDIFTRTNLTELNLSHNQLTGALPAEIRHLSNLVTLNASFNQMTGVPAEIGQLSNLEYLDLSNNQLTGLPNELGNLKKLKVFNISGNHYSQQDLDGIVKNWPSTTQVIK